MTGQQYVFGEIQHQQSAHAVIGKPLPHLGGEQECQADGMAKKRAIHVVRARRSSQP